MGSGDTDWMVTPSMTRSKRTVLRWSTFSPFFRLTHFLPIFNIVFNVLDPTRRCRPIIESFHGIFRRRP